MNIIAFLLFILCLPIHVPKHEIYFSIIQYRLPGLAVAKHSILTLFYIIAYFTYFVICFRYEYS